MSLSFQHWVLTDGKTAISFRSSSVRGTTLWAAILDKVFRLISRLFVVDFSNTPFLLSFTVRVIPLLKVVGVPEDHQIVIYKNIG